MRRVNQDEPGALDALFSAAYEELRRLAHSRLYHGGRLPTVQTTVLVNETYLRMAGSGLHRAEHRGAFFAYAAQVMRAVVVDEVRKRKAERRGGDLQRVTFDTAAAGELPVDEDSPLLVHDALLVLARTEPRLADVIVMRYFGGYSLEEIAGVLTLSVQTVRRDERKALLLLNALMKPKR